MRPLKLNIPSFFAELEQGLVARVGKMNVLSGASCATARRSEGANANPRHN